MDVLFLRQFSLKNFLIIICLIISTTTAFAKSFDTHRELQDYSFGISGGIGQPNSLKGIRVDLRKALYKGDRFFIFAEGSTAFWHVNYYKDKDIFTLSAAPVLRLYPIDMIKGLFLEASVGLSFMTQERLGRKEFASQWIFQDVFGIGYTFFDEKIDLRLQYLHHSNASLANSNPGIDVLPMISLSFQF